jgi:hypothetical protein
MSALIPQGEAFNHTRDCYLASHLAFAQTHWTRLRGLLGTSPGDFGNGWGLWIEPCHGVHTLGMGFPIDIVYLDRAGTVVYLQNNLPPWRFAPIRRLAASVLELPSHTAAQTGTAVGDRIEIRMRKKG